MTETRSKTLLSSLLSTPVASPRLTSSSFRAAWKVVREASVSVEAERPRHEISQELFGA
jgi:hypothetical protein